MVLCLIGSVSLAAAQLHGYRLHSNMSSSPVLPVLCNVLLFEVEGQKLPLELLVRLKRDEPADRTDRCVVVALCELPSACCQLRLHSLIWRSPLCRLSLDTYVHLGSALCGTSRRGSRRSSRRDCPLPRPPDNQLNSRERRGGEDTPRFSAFLPLLEGFRGAIEPSCCGRPPIIRHVEEVLADIVCRVHRAGTVT